MKPSVQAVLDVIMERIRDDALPSLGDGYAGQQLQRALQLLQSVADGMDDAAAWRFEEIRSLISLFTMALPSVPEHLPLATALQQCLQQPSTWTPESLKLSKLDAQLDELRAHLTALHAWSETTATPAAKVINQAIWIELRQSTERRKLTVGRF